MSDANRVWAEDMPDAYDRWLVPPVFAPFARDVAARVAARRPGDALELAAGTGALTRDLLAALPGLRITATDLNPPMVDLGRGRVPGAHWQQADAMQLPFADASFDVVACQFGVMFFPDRVAAYAECRRVLRTSGAFVFNTWASLDRHGFEVELMSALRDVLDAEPPQFLREIPHSYCDPELIEADVVAAGFAAVRLQELTVPGHAPSADGLARGYCLGTPLRMALADHGDVVALSDDVARRMTQLLGDGPVTAEMTALVVEADA